MKKETPVEETRSLESIISMLLGIAVVVVVGILLFNYFKGLAKNLTSKKPGNVEVNAGITGEAANTEAEFKPPENLPAKYTVKDGDSLWKISEKYFGNGYNWVDISKENNLGDGNTLLSGSEITIPKVSPRVPAKTTVTANAQTNAIEGDKYTVVKGDSLWKISVRAYQDGYKWSLIAKANKLSNPNVIHPGNVLVIPR